MPDAQCLIYAAYITEILKSVENLNTELKLTIFMRFLSNSFITIEGNLGLIS
jgi:hypothetical protein